MLVFMAKKNPSTKHLHQHFKSSSGFVLPSKQAVCNNLVITKKSL